MPSPIGIWECYGFKDKKAPNGIREVKPNKMAKLKIGKNGYVTSVLKKAFGRVAEDTMRYRETATVDVYEAFNYVNSTENQVFKFRPLENDEMVVVYPPTSKVLPNAIFYYRKINN